MILPDLRPMPKDGDICPLCRGTGYYHRRDVRNCRGCDGTGKAIANNWPDPHGTHMGRIHWPVTYGGPRS